MNESKFVSYIQIRNMCARVLCCIWVEMFLICACNNFFSESVRDWYWLVDKISNLQNSHSHICTVFNQY